MTESDGNGTTISETYSLGPVSYPSAGGPPQAVVQACNADYSVIEAEIVTTAGQVTISYTQGTLPITIAIVPSELVGGSGYTGVTALLIDGQWNCGNANEPGISLNFSPGQSTTYPIYILSQVLSNAQPTVSATELASWNFSSDAVEAGSTEFGPVTTSGPGARTCDGTQELFLYVASSSCS